MVLFISYFTHRSHSILQPITRNPSAATPVTVQEGGGNGLEVAQSHFPVASHQEESSNLQICTRASKHVNTNTSEGGVLSDRSFCFSCWALLYLTTVLDAAVWCNPARLVAAVTAEEICPTPWWRHVHPDFLQPPGWMYSNCYLNQSPSESLDFLNSPKLFGLWYLLCGVWVMFSCECRFACFACIPLVWTYFSCLLFIPAVSWHEASMIPWYMCNDNEAILFYSELLL